MNYNKFVEQVDKLYFAELGKHLSEAELIVLRGTLTRKTYEEMQTSQYSANYLKGDIGPNLWKTLSRATRERIGKKNCQAVLARKLQLKPDEIMPPQETIPSYSGSEVVDNATSANKPENQVNKKKIIISWFNERGKHLGETLSKTIFHYPLIETSVNPLEKDLDKEHFSKVITTGTDNDFWFICITPSSSPKKWLQFEIGRLFGIFGQHKTFKFLSLGSEKDLTEPFSRLPTIDCTNRYNLANLLQEIIDGDRKQALDWVDFKLSSSDWKDLIKEHRQLPVKDESTDFMLGLTNVQENLEYLLQDNQYFRTNQVFQKLIVNFVRDVFTQLNQLGTNGSVYSLPLELYPRYLTSLQRDINPQVKAVAIVNNVEMFWASDEGEEICKTTAPESERLFVFFSQKDFNNSFKFLVQHASCYKVFITSAEKYYGFTKEFSLREHEISKYVAEEDHCLPTNEYSIIELNKRDCLLAWYHEDNVKESKNKRIVHFCAEQEKAAHYKNLLTNFLNNSGVFSLKLEDQDCRKIIKNFKEIGEAIFRQKNNYADPNNINSCPFDSDLDEQEAKYLAQEVKDLAQGEELAKPLPGENTKFVSPGADRR